MKAIMMSIKPQWVAKILNGEKTIEIRKRFPKDYVGWVYIYCTKNGGMTYKYEDSKYHITTIKNYFPHYCINAKVVARFWCDKVEQVFWHNLWDEHFPYLKSCNLLKCACLCQDEFEEYVGDSESYAIHITKLEIFDKPKEISEFKPHYGYPTNHRLTRAPQSYCFIEVSE